MIIVEAKNGPVLINDASIRELMFNQEDNAVFVDYGDNLPVKPFGTSGATRNHIKDVEQVMYVPDCVPEKYQYKCSRLVNVENELRNSIKANRYWGELFEIYRDALFEVRQLIDRANDDVLASSYTDILHNTAAKRNAAEERYKEELLSIQKK